MARDDRFTFLVNGDERRMLAAVAEKLQRSQSDAVRLLIRAAAAKLDDKPEGAGHE
jgi:hypothetical protein